MTWRGCDPAIECKTIEEFMAYLQSLNFSSWRPSGMVLHNTASPTLAQWWGGGTPPAQRMENLRDYYENDMGWSAGPHAFVDGVSIWIFTNFNVKGVHSPSYNGTRLGIEAVGDYNVEDDETGAGAKVMEMTAALFGECHSFFGWEPSNDSIKLHKEDPSTDHDCPGKHVVKDEFIDDVNEYMGEAGDDHDQPELPHHGVVEGVPAGDTLNIRATPSASSAVVGTAVNGDRVEIIAEAYNGATRWLRLEVGSRTSPDMFGWVNADYIDVLGEISPSKEWRTSITATVFGNEGDEQETAYGGWVDGDVAGVALPYKFTGERPRVIVEGAKGQAVEAEIIDLGPWNTHNPSYVFNGFRPLVEQQYADKVPAQNGMIPTNDAGIDLAPRTAAAVGVDGRGKVRWRFA